MSGDDKKATRSSSRGKREKDAKTEEAADAATTTKATSKKETGKKDSAKDETSKNKDVVGMKAEESTPQAKKDTATKDTTSSTAGTDKATQGDKKAAADNKKQGELDEKTKDADAGDKPDEGAPADATTPSKEVVRTVYWPAAERRYDEITIEDDFEFDDETQTITAICDKPPRHFPNTHFCRRLAGHLRLGLGRNATKEAILEKICQAHYGTAFTRPPVEDETSSSKKRRASDGGAGSSTVLKKRPVLLKAGSSKKGSAAAAAVEATLKARAEALNAVSASLETIATTIKTAEERLQKLCEAADVNFYTALMDRSKLTNEYLITHFTEYDQFLATQKDMIANITELSKGNDLKGPVAKAAAAAAAATSGGVAAMTVGVAIPAAVPDPDEVTNHMEV